MEEKFKKLMDVDFKGAYITTEPSVSYYNKKHAAGDNSYFVKATKDRVLLMVTKFGPFVLSLCNAPNIVFPADVYLLSETFLFNPCL